MPGQVLSIHLHRFFPCQAPAIATSESSVTSSSAVRKDVSSSTATYRDDEASHFQPAGAWVTPCTEILEVRIDAVVTSAC